MTTRNRKDSNTIATSAFSKFTGFLKECEKERRYLTYFTNILKMHTFMSPHLLPSSNRSLGLTNFTQTWIRFLKIHAEGYNICIQEWQLEEILGRWWSKKYQESISHLNNNRTGKICLMQLFWKSNRPTPTMGVPEGKEGKRKKEHLKK